MSFLNLSQSIIQAMMGARSVPAPGGTVPAGGIATSSNISFSTTSITPVDITGATFTLITTGRPVFLCFLDPSATGSIAVNKLSAGTIKFVRGATSIGGAGQFGVSNPAGASLTDLTLALPGTSIFFLDTPSAGTYTYKAQGNVSNSLASLTLGGLIFAGWEI